MLITFPNCDAEIKSRVNQELRWDCRTETSPISVSVANGVVTLSGRVKYYAIKHAAEEAAHRIAGVVSVQNNLEVKIPFAEFRADYELADEIRRAFAWNVLVPHEQLSIRMDNGIVTLYGKVDCLTQRAEAERAVINLLGVRGIVNNIVVKAQPLATETVCNAIHNSLARQAVGDTQEITVALDEGAVRLSGLVPSWNHRCAVVVEAAFAPGVRQVVDDLKIAVNA